ncbi:hypothetical protein Tco_0243330 [Tanacetum coccineum]
MDVKGAMECMQISGFMHGITNPELIKQLHDKILKTVDEMMRVTTSFHKGEVAASIHERKKSFPPWKQQEGNQKQNFKKGGFQNQQRPKKKQDQFMLLIKTPKEIFCFRKREIQSFATNDDSGREAELHQILCSKQNSGKGTAKRLNKGETSGKDKALDILMVQPWERVARQKITQSFCPNIKFLYPPLDEDEGTESPMIIEAEIGGHCIHRMYVDGGSASEILYEHCFNRLRPEIKNQLVPATSHFDWDFGEIIMGIGQNTILEIIGRLGSQRNIASSSVNSSRNVVAPGRRRSNYPKKQQVGPAGMCIGL